MLAVGSDDGVYTVEGLGSPGETTATQRLESGQVMRLRQFEDFDGVFAATATGLFHSRDGETWTELGVPQSKVYAVGATPRGPRLFAGTRPAHLYTATIEDGGLEPSRLDWRELDGFQDLPSRPEWRTPRHDDIAQVRDVKTPAAAPEHVVTAVEVGGVHVSTDGGTTWEERRGAVHDDVHELHVVDERTFLAATGFGLYRTTDAGHNWIRLDEGVEQEYVRAVIEHEGVIYASAAHGPSTTWDDAEADPVLLEGDGGDGVEPVASPYPDEVVIGWAVRDDGVIGATHGGHLIARRDDGWEAIGEFPIPGATRGRYAPLTVLES